MNFPNDFLRFLCFTSLKISLHFSVNIISTNDNITDNNISCFTVVKIILIYLMFKRLDALSSCNKIRIDDFQKRIHWFPTVMEINRHRIIEGVWLPWYFSHGGVTSDSSISRAERDKESLTSTILFFANKRELRPTCPSEQNAWLTTFTTKIRESVAKEYCLNYIKHIIILFYVIDVDNIIIR